VPGKSTYEKISNLSQVLINKPGFLECKQYFYNKELWITAIFDNKENMLECCILTLFEGNDFTLNPITNKGDEEVRKCTLII
jgi:hypothetical protein